MGLMLVGQEVELDIIRDNKKRTVRIVVEHNADKVLGTSLNPLLKGCVFSNQVTRAGRAYVELESLERNSKLFEYGLQVGDIVLSVNRVGIANVDELREALKKDKSAVLLNVQRGRRASYVLIQ